MHLHTKQTSCKATADVSMFTTQSSERARNAQRPKDIPVLWHRMCGDEEGRVGGFIMGEVLQLGTASITPLCVPVVVSCARAVLLIMSGGWFPASTCLACTAIVLAVVGTLNCLFNIVIVPHVLINMQGVVSGDHIVWVTVSGPVRKGTSSMLPFLLAGLRCDLIHCPCIRQHACVSPCRWEPALEATPAPMHTACLNTGSTRQGRELCCFSVLCRERGIPYFLQQNILLACMSKFGHGCLRTLHVLLADHVCSPCL
jgi:hypothetical protein